MREHVAHRDRLLAVDRKLGPKARDRRVRVESSTLDQEVGTDRGDTLGGREHEHDGFLPPRRVRARVRDPAPKVDHRLAIAVHTHRRADLAALVEVARELVEDGLVSRFHRAGDVYGHAGACYYRKTRTGNDGKWRTSLMSDRRNPRRAFRRLLRTRRDASPSTNDARTCAISRETLDAVTSPISTSADQQTRYDRAGRSDCLIRADQVRCLVEHRSEERRVGKECR